MDTENHYQETDLGNIAPNPRGEYSPEESYEYLDLVVFEGGSYVCLAENGATITGISPESGKTTQYWQVITIPGSLTPEYIAMHDRVVNLSEQVEADAEEVRTAEQNVSGIEMNVAQMQEQTRQSAEAAERSKDSAAGYASSADASRLAAEESEQNINAHITGFDIHVAEKTEEAENDIEAARIASNKAIIAQQEQSVNEVARVGIEAVSAAQAAAQTATEKAQAAATSEENAAASETAAKLSETNATKMAEQVAADKEQVANDRTAVENAKQEMTGSVAQIEKNAQGISELKGDLANTESRLSESIVVIYDAVVEGTNIENRTDVEFFAGQGNSYVDRKTCHSETWNVDDFKKLNIHFDNSKYQLRVYAFNQSDAYRQPVIWTSDSPVNCSELNITWENFKSFGVELKKADGSTYNESDITDMSATTYSVVETETGIHRNSKKIEEVEEHLSNIDTEIGTIPNLYVKFDAPEIVVPSKLYAVVGHEFFVHYDNILKCYTPENYVVTTECDENILAHKPEYDNCLRFTPTSADIGTHNVTFKAIDRRTWKAVATKSTHIVIVADKQISSQKKLMFIGDSLTYRGLYSAELENMNNFKSIGTISRKIEYPKGTEYTVNIEGRNSWSSYNYADQQSFGAFDNAFYNPSTQHFDFAYYLQKHSMQVPDVVFLNLGTNGGNGYAIQNVIAGLDTLIASIKEYSTSIPIAVHIYPTPSRAGNTDRGLAKRTVWSDKDSRIDYYDCIKKYINKYDGTDTQVHLVPVYHLLDPVYDYQRETVPVSARNQEMITIGKSDGTHPANSGYLHMADAYYNWLMYYFG